MKRLSVPALLLSALLLLMAACGSDTTADGADEPTADEPTAGEPTADPVTTTAPVETPEPTDTPTTPPTAPTATPEPSATPEGGGQAAQEQRDLLEQARALWQENGPDAYEITYTLVCECDQGPYRVTVEDDGTATSEHLTEGAAGADGPYLSVEDMYAAVEDALDEGRFPVEVTYDATNGVPIEYVFNRPELPVDGGFILRVDDFVARTDEPDNGEPGEPDDEQAALATAMQRWEEAGVSGEYEYVFSSVCFCPPEFVGPYRAAVVDGEVVDATYEGVDLFEVDVLDIDSYGDLVLTVDEVFAEIERAIDEADSFTAEYHPDLGYPTDVFIDWDARLADEEAGYRISDLASPTRSCSTAVVNIRLIPQPDLPDAVKARRRQIFDTALTCNFAALEDLTNPDGFTASFGGGDPSDIWSSAESAGDPVMLTLVQLLNKDYATIGEGSELIYTWPAAFVETEGYLDYRVGIDAAGNWLYFVAGD